MKSLRLIAAALLLITLEAFAAAPVAPHKLPFAPGVISGSAGADAPAFAPDGNLVVFDSPPSLVQSRLMISRRIHGVWTKPTVAPFSGRWYDQDPVMAPDGSYLVFVSNRPRPGDHRPMGPHDGNLWRVERRGIGWSTPQWLPAVVNDNPHIYAPSVAADGSIYYTSGGQSYVCAFRHGRNLAAQEVVVPGSKQVGDPVIAPDGSFLVFDAVKAGKADLFLSFRGTAGWEPAVDLDTSADGDSNWDPRLGPQARRLYFSSQRHGVIGIWSISLAPWLSGRDRRDHSGLREKPPLALSGKLAYANG